MDTLLSESDTTVVRQVANHIKARIVRENLKRGAPLPTYRELSAELGVAYRTVKCGLDELVADGVVFRRRGRGTFVDKELALLPRKLEHVGLIFPGSRSHLFSYPYLGETMRGITQDAPSSSDMHIFSLREDGMVHAAQLGEWDISGTILLGVENDEYLRAFAQWGTPGVVVDYCSQAAPLDYVACDDRSAAQQVVAHLAALGHRCVAYMAGQSQWPVLRGNGPQTTLLVKDSCDARERRAESVLALRDRNMLACDWMSSEIGKNWVPAAVDELLRAAPADRPTALVAENNYSALSLMRELARRGLRAPEDISVCAVASDGDSSFDGIPLTACRFDFFGMGRKAIALLAERCKEPGLAEPRVHRIGYKFVEGQTSSAR